MFHYLPSHLPLQDKSRQNGKAEQWQLPGVLCNQTEFRGARLSAETAEDIVTHSAKPATSRTQTIPTFPGHKPEKALTISTEMALSGEQDYIQLQLAGWMQKL